MVETSCIVILKVNNLFYKKRKYERIQKHVCGKKHYTHI